MAYEIQGLTEQGYDFAALYPEKQESVRASTGLDFNLESIVKFLQKQTNNFSIDNQLAHDLDNAIFALVKKKGEATPEIPPIPIELSVSEKIIEEFESVIDTLDLYSVEEQEELIKDFEIEMDGLEILDDDEESQIRFKLLRDMLIPKLKQLKN